MKATQLFGLGVQETLRELLIKQTAIQAMLVTKGVCSSPELQSAINDATTAIDRAIGDYRERQRAAIEQEMPGFFEVFGDLFSDEDQRPPAGTSKNPKDQTP